MDNNDASPGQKGKVRTNEKFSSISSLNHLDGIINAMPYPVLVLNEKRQIIVSNREAIKKLKATDLSEFLGKRPGDALNCTNALETEKGCGYSNSCQLCGIYTTILKSQKEKKQIQDDCRIIALNIDSFEFHNFEITAAPIYLEQQEYTVLTLLDNTSLKKKEMMERLFFHDILNTAGNIKNFTELILNNPNRKTREDMLRIIENLSGALVEEIMGQKSISEAEDGDLSLNYEYIKSDELLKLISNQYQHYLRKNNSVIIDNVDTDITFYSDRGIITRVLNNMTKNAIESSAEGEIIRIGAYLNGNILTFRVNNRGIIPDSVKKQIFHKGFSTKDKGRGYGTYSMKLLGEKYLKGKVYFTSNESEGTTFYLDINI